MTPVPCLFQPACLNQLQAKRFGVSLMAEAASRAKVFCFLVNAPAWRSAWYSQHSSFSRRNSHQDAGEEVSFDFFRPSAVPPEHIRTHMNTIQHTIPYYTNTLYHTIPTTSYDWAPHQYMAQLLEVPGIARRLRRGWPGLEMKAW